MEIEIKIGQVEESSDLEVPMPPIAIKITPSEVVLEYLH